MDIGALREKLGVEERSVSEGDLEVVSPIDGSAIGSVTCSGVRQDRRGGGPSPGGVCQLAIRARSQARRADPAVRPGATRAQGPAGRAGDHRVRQDSRGGSRRSPGDDRHLRLRRRPVAPALRTDHRLGATRAQNAGDLASARPGGRDQRLQLSGRRLVVELRHRHRLRRSGAVEALGKDAGDRAGLSATLRRGSSAPWRRARPPFPAAPGRTRSGRRSGHGSTSAADQRHRKLPDGARGRSARGGALRPLSAGAGWQQRHDRDRERRPRARAARHPLQRDGNSRPALHHAAPPDRPRRRVRQS